MTQDNNIAPVQGARITVIDALRGFALFGVMWIHMQQRFGIFSMGMMQGGESATPTLDAVVGWLTNNVFMGRFINIFAFLFGMSFFIQMDRAAKKGIDFRGRFLWRMVILAVIGVIGSWFTYLEILTLYAIFGVILIILFPLKNRVLMIIFALLVAGGPRWGSYIYDKVTAPEQIEMTQMTQMPAPPMQVAPATTEDSVTTDGADGTEAPQFDPSQFDFSQFEMPETTFWSDAKANMTSGFIRKMGYQMSSGRAYLTLALFILGLVVGRIRFFETIDEKRKRNIKLFFISLAVWLGGVGLQALIPQPEFVWGAPPTAISLLRTTLGDINMVTMSVSITLGFVLLYGNAKMRKALDTLTPYGRMGLTNYELQGIIGCFLFSGWALGGTFSGLSATMLALIGVVFYIIQILFSRWWLNNFKYGPWEWFWRSATYLKWQPFKR
ncbi:MAG: DUF418 domain-containing protein [Alistipes sp.]|nr:DUF418 domain-containing protein [Alistipes sp.]